MKSITITPNKVRRLLESLGRITTEDAIRGNTLSPEEIDGIVDLYPEWETGVLVTVGTIRKYKAGLYEVVQEHTTQATWTPPQVPALWKQVSAAGVIPEWTQPTGAQDAYPIGARVIHDNPNEGGALWIYESAIDANTTEPGRDGALDRYWTPIEPA